MAIADLTGKIIKDAHLLKDEILKSAHDKVSYINSETENKKAEIKKSYEIELEKALGDNERKVRATANLESKMKVEEKKRDLVESVFHDTLSKIVAYDDSSYKKWLEKLATSLPKEIKANLVCPKSRLEITKEVLVKRGVVVGATEVADFEAGFLLKGGDFEYNLDAKEILRKIRDEKEIEVANILFG